MEHKAETIIQKKIRAAEKQPVIWHKHDVWKKVNGQLHQKSNRYYYAAAAIFFFVFSVFGWLQYTQHQLNVKIGNLETRIEEAKENTSATGKDTFLQSSICNEENPAPEKSLPTTIKPGTFRHERLREVSESFNEVAFQESIENNIGEVVFPVDSTLAETNSGNTHRIESIIGVYDRQQKSEKVVSTKKRNRIKFFKSDEAKSADEAHQNTIVIARIK